MNLPEKDTRHRSDDVKSQKNLAWSDIITSKALLKGIFEAGFEDPSPIQEEVIPRALMGSNVCARAKVCVVVVR